MKLTVNVETFAGLNICGFSPVKFFTGILSQCLSQQCLLFNYKKFCVTLRNHRSLVQRIFPLYSSFANYLALQLAGNMYELRKFYRYIYVACVPWYVFYYKRRWYFPTCRLVWNLFICILFIFIISFHFSSSLVWALSKAKYWNNHLIDKLSCVY